MDCFGDWVCGVVCGGVWIGGLVYGVCEEEGIWAVCDLPDCFGGGGFVFCFADGMRRREPNAETQSTQRKRGEEEEFTTELAEGRGGNGECWSRRIGRRWGEFDWGCELGF